MMRTLNTKSLPRDCDCKGRGSQTTVDCRVFAQISLTLKVLGLADFSKFITPEFNLLRRVLSVPEQSPVTTDAPKSLRLWQNKKLRIQTDLTERNGRVKSLKHVERKSVHESAAVTPIVPARR
jgi:hypothetical protein